MDDQYINIPDPVTLIEAQLYMYRVAIDHELNSGGELSTITALIKEHNEVKQHLDKLQAKKTLNDN